MDEGESSEWASLTGWSREEVATHPRAYFEFHENLEARAVPEPDGVQLTSDERDFIFPKFVRRSFSTATPVI
jgi:hypothetical protein